jgi:hypothetical protein
MKAVIAESVLAESRQVMLRDVLRKHIQRTMFSVDGVSHRLRIVAVNPGPGLETSSVRITVTTDNTRRNAEVHVARARLDRPEFVSSLLAHAMRGVLTGELPSDAVEAL